MAQKGPISKSQKELEEQLQLVSIDIMDSVERPRPPIDFDDREAEVWTKIVNSMPSDWFNIASVPLLTQYVRHAIAAQNLATLIADVTANTEELDINTYLKLLRAQKEESGSLSSLATKLRISNQALINKRGNHKEAGAASKPWEE